MKQGKRTRIRLAIEWPGWHREISTPGQTRRLCKWIGLAFCLLLAPVYGICPWVCLVPLIYFLVPVHVIVAILTARSWLLDTRAGTQRSLVKVGRIASITILSGWALTLACTLSVHDATRAVTFGGGQVFLALGLQVPDGAGVTLHRAHYPGPSDPIWFWPFCFGLTPPHWYEGPGPKGIWMAQYSFPLWLPLSFFAIPATWLYWRDRRRIPPGHCQSCGYNLTGNESGICPECGTACQVEGEAG